VRNLHPVDRLAHIRSQIRSLEEEEAALRNYLLDHETDRVGNQYVAQIWSWPQRRIDTKGLIKEVGAAVVERFTTISKVMTVRLKSREPVENRRLGVLLRS